MAHLLAKELVARGDGSMVVEQLAIVEPSIILDPRVDPSRSFVRLYETLASSWAKVDDNSYSCVLVDVVMMHVMMMMVIFVVGLECLCGRS